MDRAKLDEALTQIVERVVNAVPPGATPTMEERVALSQVAVALAIRGLWPDVKETENK